MNSKVIGLIIASAVTTVVAAAVAIILPLALTHTGVFATTIYSCK